MTFKTYQTLKYLFIAISSIAILNCSSSSSSTPVPNAEPEQPTPSGKYYKFQNGVVEGVDFETNSGKTGTVSSDKGFTYNVGDEKITFKIKDLIIGTFDITKLKDGETLLVSDIVGVERDDTVNKDVLKMLRVLHSLDRDKNPLNGIFIDDTTKNKLVGLSEGKTKITDNDIYELKALMVKAGKELVVEKKARDYYKKYVLTPLGITPKFNPFTLEIETKSTNESFTFQAPTGFTYAYTVDWGDSSDIETGITTEAMGTHTYAKAGKYIIKVSGDFPLLSLDAINKAKITQVLAWGDIEWQSFSSTFSNVGADTGFNTTDTPDLGDVESMHSTFINSNISAINFINDWDVSNVTNMTTMFNKTSSFNQDISKWNVSNVTTMANMFDGASNFNQNISAWNTSMVTNMNSMFLDAKSFNKGLSGWNDKVLNVTDMDGMFNGATNFNQDLSGWKVNDKVSHASFAGGSSLEAGNFPPFK